jgi:hypothetical protein
LKVQRTGHSSGTGTSLEGIENGPQQWYWYPLEGTEKGQHQWHWYPFKATENEPQQSYWYQIEGTVKLVFPNFD